MSGLIGPVLTIAATPIHATKKVAGAVVNVMSSFRSKKEQQLETRRKTENAVSASAVLSPTFTAVNFVDGVYHTSELSEHFVSSPTDVSVDISKPRGRIQFNATAESKAKEVAKAQKRKEFIESISKFVSEDSPFVISILTDFLKEHDVCRLKPEPVEAFIGVDSYLRHINFRETCNFGSFNVRRGSNEKFINLYEAVEYQKLKTKEGKVGYIYTQLSEIFNFGLGEIENLISIASQQMFKELQMRVDINFKRVDDHDIAPFMKGFALFIEEISEHAIRVESCCDYVVLDSTNGKTLVTIVAKNCFVLDKRELERGEFTDKSSFVVTITKKS